MILYPRLIESRVADKQGLRYLTLDDDLTLLAAREGPVGMICGLDRVVIDEIQRAPQLLLAEVPATWARLFCYLHLY